MISLGMLSVNSGEEEKDYYECVEKVNSYWSVKCDDCTAPDFTYKVVMKNICNEAIDFQIALQNKNNKWQVYYMENMQPNDTLVAWACYGNGKSLMAARKAGDKNTSLINVNTLELFGQ